MTARLFSRGSLLMGVCAIATWSACGGPEFKADANVPGQDASVDAPRDAAGGRGGSAGAAGNAGRSGSAGSSGNAGNSGNAGTSGTDGGTACTADSCGAQNYCNTDSGKCAPCSEVSRFRFAQPETFALADGSLSERFPRTTASAREMLFRLGNDGTEHSLGVTPDFGSSTASQPFGAGVDVPGQAESGALQAQFAASFGMLPNFYFDRSVPDGVGTKRVIFGGTRTTGTTVTAVQPLGAVVNESTSSNYSLAVAGEAGRFWWMSTRNSPSVLLTTALSGAGMMAQPSVVSIKLGAAGCSRSAVDSTPWAAPDGSFLLFGALETEAGCMPQDKGRDLFVVVLQPNGQPVQSAISLLDVNKAGVDDTDPSMSDDLCSLYFASNTGGSTFRLYRARRR